MPLPVDYVERAYAGVLGKIIGVYLGRPFEGWTYERIMAELGEIDWYMHEKRKVPLVVTDDDISGTFTFLRALPDNGNDPAISPAQIGATWLNYLIENRTVLWWGGMGHSTEHTAYLRLKAGVPAPESGSAARNGRVVAEQIGAQIFIDGWAMVCPGDPQKAADLARRAGSVSHDGVALHGAQLMAAMEALAFVEPRVDALLDAGLRCIPADCLIRRMVDDVRSWHAGDGDWRRTRERIAERYGYGTYGGNCHMVPNHALIHLGLLYGEDDFRRAMTVVNTSGWDTDCNAGNLGCLEGIRLGLAGLEAGPDWRGPVADRMYLPTADGGRCVTDAVSEAYRIVNAGRALSGEAPTAPKGGARFHFSLPGSVQGFRPEDGSLLSLENGSGRGLALRYRGVAPGREACAATAVFVQPEDLAMPGYTLYASPTLYPGQTVHAVVSADAGNAAAVVCRIALSVYGPEDRTVKRRGPEEPLEPGGSRTISWPVPDLGGQPVSAVGIEVVSPRRAQGTVHLDLLTWDGTPEAVFTRPAEGGTAWRKAWVNGVDRFESPASEPFRLVQDSGRGLLITGCREWADYAVEADVTPHMAAAAGLAARVQGMRRYYALLLRGGDAVVLVKMRDGETVLAREAFRWSFDRTYALALQVVGDRVTASLDGRELFSVRDADLPLDGGGVALVCEEGRTGTRRVAVSPVR